MDGSDPLSTTNGAAEPRPGRSAACPCCGVGADEDSAWALASLKEMAEIGLDLMRRVHAESTARSAEPASPPGPIGGKDPVAAYDRLTRSLRLTLALRDRFVGTAETRAREGAEEYKERFRRVSEHPRVARQAERISDVVATALKERGVDPGDADDILGEIRMQLIDRECLHESERDHETDILRMTIAEAVTFIAEAFGIRLDPGRWVDATMTLEEAASRPLPPRAATKAPNGHAPPASAARPPPAPA